MASTSGQAPGGGGTAAASRGFPVSVAKPVPREDAVLVFGATGKLGRLIVAEVRLYWFENGRTAPWCTLQFSGTCGAVLGLKSMKGRFGSVPCSMAAFRGYGLGGCFSSCTFKTALVC